MLHINEEEENENKDDDVKIGDAQYIINFPKKSQTVIEYWIRVMYGYPKHFVLDLVIMMVELSNFCERFDQKLSSKYIIYTDKVRWHSHMKRTNYKIHG